MDPTWEFPGNGVGGRTWRRLGAGARLAHSPAWPTGQMNLEDLLVSRRWLLGAGATALVLAACRDNGGGGDTSVATTSTTSTTATAGGTTSTGVAPLTAADFAALGICVLIPEQTAGPFPLDEQFDRRDITEGAAGQPMRLGFRVVDEVCTPVPGAAVEIWHCDATGDYSAFTDNGGGKDEGRGTTFLRGTQTAGDDGIVEFLTIVPGWYSGRAVHVHLRVHIDDSTVLTSQVYFDEALLTEVYATDPYAAFGLPDTSIERDRIAGDAEGDGTILHTTAAETTAGAGTLALLNVGAERG
jgi:protocatechuate 3,4-dioxygenase beta subunit